MTRKRPLSDATAAEDSDNITRLQLLARCWTAAALKKWLGLPDVEHCGWGRYTYVVHRYDARQVAVAEADTAWQRWHESLLRRRVRAQRAALRGTPEPCLAARLATFKATKPAVLIDRYDSLVEITREAKRQRDESQAAYRRGAYDIASISSLLKQRLYRTKGQAIAHMMLVGELCHIEYHTFEGDRWAAIVAPPSRPEIRLHVPCAPVVDVVPCADLGESIPAHPSGEVRSKDAILTLEKYLEGRKVLQVFSWPTRLRPVRVLECYECGGVWIGGQCMDCGRGC